MRHLAGIIYEIWLIYELQSVYICEPIKKTSLERPLSIENITITTTSLNTIPHKIKETWNLDIHTDELRLLYNFVTNNDTQQHIIGCGIYASHAQTLLLKNSTYTFLDYMEFYTYFKNYVRTFNFDESMYSLIDTLDKDHYKLCNIQHHYQPANS